MAKITPDEVRTDLTNVVAFLQIYARLTNNKTIQETVDHLEHVLSNELSFATLLTAMTNLKG